MDIVEHYIRKPFSCALIGGNLEFKAEYNGGGNKQASVYTMIHIVLYVLYKTVTFSGFWNMYLTELGDFKGNSTFIERTKEKNKYM